MKLCHEKQGTGEKLDVMDVIFHELWFIVIDQCAPAYGPYIMKLIYATWAKYHNGARLDQVHEVFHLEKRLCIKPHTLPADRFKKGKKASDAPVDEPSWFKKFQIQLKKTFCLSLDLQERMYDAHVQEKKARLHQK